MSEIKHLIDNTDKQILNVLLDNSRLSYREIAKKIKVSVATVMHHVNKLEKEKIIKKYSAILDYEKLGYDVEITVHLKIGKGKLLELEQKLSKHKNVYAVYDITGKSDAIIIARFKNRRSMDSFLKKIQTYDFIERTETSLILNTIKEDFLKVE
ncbi:AsnC family transcriptional regulator [Candidatus Woesearchaeota archaeon CG10_big_fil_rev_8_21_14_0_10_30_7]|nr:MAG: AsnC family transcriptional regulator [Candidatus Woesearchaeota archaeon CG10_big_fil_rev_8_21_14_0_10_30_7]